MGEIFFVEKTIRKCNAINSAAVYESGHTWMSGGKFIGVS